MRIVFVNSARGWGGGLTSAVEVALGLAEIGHEVTLVCHPRSAIRRRLQDDQRLTLEPIAIRAELNPIRVLQLARLTRRSQPAIVLGDKRKDVKLCVAARRLGADFPIVHRHGSPSALKDSRIYRRVWGRELQALIVNSETMRRRLLERAPYLEGRTIHVIRNGKDTTRYQPMPQCRAETREALGIREDAFVVSFHGMVQPRKNVNLMVRAIAELPRRLKVHALIVGGGPDRKALRKLAAELNVPAAFTGIREDIPQLLSAADAAVHLSVAEGFSNSVIEAMACGLPVIASDATSHPEQIESGVHGILVPPGQWEGVADAIRWLAMDPDERERMGKAARERAITQFSVQRMVERYDAVLRDTVDAYRS